MNTDTGEEFSNGQHVSLKIAALEARVEALEAEVARLTDRLRAEEIIQQAAEEDHSYGNDLPLSRRPRHLRAVQ
jgi:hypothetical protein